MRMDALLSHKKIALHTYHSCIRTHAYYLLFYNKKYSFMHDLNIVFSHTFIVYKPSYIRHIQYSPVYRDFFGRIHDFWMNFTEKS